MKTPVSIRMRGNPQLSPAAKYITWWSDPDSAWFAWAANTGQTRRLTNNDIYPFFNEENDVPDYPGAYGQAGWLENDQAMLVYDQFDIYRVDPNGNTPAKRLTKGRERNLVYRYIRLDPEEKSIKTDAKMLLHRFDKISKAEGYAWLDLATGQTSVWYDGEFAFTKNVIKAKDANAVLFTCENFQTYPDLLYSTFIPGKTTANPKFRRVSNINPQQVEYLWGSIEKVQWTSLNGEPLEGLLVKPENFDPTRKYPMVVYYYERLSDGLHQHRAPDAHRSSINFTIYASRGYLVFAPDIHYRTGYPGESAYDAVMSGVQHLIEKGFVDNKRIGLQGHSWGGYQTAYLVTRTKMFACAEAGAPVANMTSAYGGIRWESGLNRQFQYEHQQSRIGGSLWEYPMRYLENSPLFALDKVNTPLLILHNDEDGAVPWYQGIELFTGLRRLGQPCWMLNYNGEPHWPVKLQNRLDFQTRMLQFFDHFLQEGPLPPWMERGVPPMEKGIRHGLK
jgi:dipeptidyl aminopeptidase/acylaminoacyl peptidase